MWYQTAQMFWIFFLWKIRRESFCFCIWKFSLTHIKYKKPYTRLKSLIGSSVFNQIKARHDGFRNLKTTCCKNNNNKSWTNVFFRHVFRTVPFSGRHLFFLLTCVINVDKMYTQNWLDFSDLVLEQFIKVTDFMKDKVYTYVLRWYQARVKSTKVVNSFFLQTGSPDKKKTQSCRKWMTFLEGIS